MKRKIVSLFLAICMVLTLLPGTVSAAGTASPASAPITMADTIKLAAVTHAKLSGSSYTFPASSPWYQVYVDYLNEAGGFPVYYSMDYSIAATRDQFANVMSGVLSVLPESQRNRNRVPDGAIPDVPDAFISPHVYGLYRAGIMVGSDGNGTFHPQSTIQRSEVAAIVNRFIDPSARKSIDLSAAQPTTSTASANDQTGFTPKDWGWEVDGTEGYGQTYFTSGMYVRSDNKAVLYIESSSSYEYFSYQLYALPEGSKASAYWAPGEMGGDYGSSYANAQRDGSKALDEKAYVSFTSTGKQITVASDWIDDLYIYLAAPDGVYTLVREKK